jgi:hypothetical protein
MPRYIIERNVDVSGMSEEELDAAGRESIQVANSIPGLKWIRSYVSEAEGKVYCEYEAPNPEAIREHARLTGWPADKISRVAMEYSPDMFQ